MEQIIKTYITYEIKYTIKNDFENFPVFFSKNDHVLAISNIFLKFLYLQNMILESSEMDIQHLNVEILFKIVFSWSPN